MPLDIAYIFGCHVILTAERMSIQLPYISTFCRLNPQGLDDDVRLNCYCFGYPLEVEIYECI